MKFLNIIFLVLVLAILSLFLTKRAYIFVHEYLSLEGVFESVYDKNLSDMVATFLNNDIKNLSDSKLQISFINMRGFCYNSDDTMPSDLSDLFHINSFKVDRMDKYFSKFNRDKDYLLLINNDDSVIPVFFDKKNADFQFSVALLKNRIEPDINCFSTKNFEMSFRQQVNSKNVNVFIRQVE